MIRAALLVAALAATTASDSKDLAKALAGRVAGKPETCLSTTRLGTPRAIGDSVLLYQDGTRIWRNDLPDACPALDRDPIIVTETFGGQLCRNDMFYTIERSGGGIPGPRCRLGAFVPWEKPKAPATTARSD